MRVALLVRQGVLSLVQLAVSFAPGLRKGSILSWKDNLPLLARPQEEAVSVIFSAGGIPFAIKFDFHLQTDRLFNHIIFRPSGRNAWAVDGGVGG
ncbi:MAG: hypothetical protein RLZZ165_2408 [Bacteroidota bacterium]